MIAALIGLALTGAGEAVRAPVAQAVPAGEESDIVVLARRARNVRVVFGRNAEGRLSWCRVLKSSGDAAIDQLWCTALDRCSPDMSVAAAAVKACAKPLRRKLVAELAAARKRRAGASDSTSALDDHQGREGSVV